MDATVGCYQSELIRRRCSKCGNTAERIHIPVRQVGYYCEKCCPACEPIKA